MTVLFRIEEPAGRAPQGFALWQLGFRPFYLLASFFAALSIPLWALQFAGILRAQYLPGPLWHAHEMIFGFALAVIVGFLFTAGRNWTQKATPTGWPLAALAALWLAGRVLVLTPYAWASAIANAGFPLAAAVALAIPFIAAGNRRNYFFIALLVAMSGACLAVHLSQMGLIGVPSWAGIQLALDFVLFIVCVMAGRVVPMFTNNGVPGASASRHPLAEKGALGSVLVLIAADAIGLPAEWVAATAFTGALFHLVRWWLWQPWRTLRHPLVWVLHAAYAWVPVHLALRASASLGWIAPSAATHALTAGAVAGLIIGMMTRTAKGHTGRQLKADRWDVASYLCVAAAALTRVGGVFMPESGIAAIVFSSALWSVGFAIYAVRYAGPLIRPRPDGKPG